MSFSLVQEVLNEGPVSQIDKLVLVYLADMAREEGFCSPTIARLAELTNWSASTILRSLGRLRFDGWIVANESHGKVGWTVLPVSPKVEEKVS